MTMKRVGISVALVAMLAVAPSRSAVATAVSEVTETQVAAAAAGYFEAGTTFNGVSVQGATLGIGLIVYSDGSATGDLEIVLAGTVLNQPQNLTVVGKVGAGAANLDGSVTFSGNGTLDMGDGSLPTPVPFTVVVTTSGLQLTVGATPLPTLPISDGSIFIG
jgi:hypothetical protein